LFFALSGLEQPTQFDPIISPDPRYVLDIAVAEYHDKLLHFKYDLLAQLRREYNQRHPYAGIDALITISWGNPRNLLTILKHVVSWASFKGERLLADRPISVSAQSAGVKEAAEWFMRDARFAGNDGRCVEEAINRLGTMFRAIRYSDKPSECSLSTFSYDVSAVTVKTRRLIDIAEKSSLLIHVGRQRDRNSLRVDMKLQLNRMLAPLWDISYGRRGVLPLSGGELDIIFDPEKKLEFEKMLEKRIDRMMAPFFGQRPDRRKTEREIHPLLPGMDDD
jgi:hypothetical protein